MAKTGRKGKYEDWLTPQGRLLIEKWALDGLSQEQIAQNMGIARQTLIEWKNRFPDIADSLKKGRAVVVAALQNKLIQKAMSGDLGAIIFSLKNLAPESWRDKPDGDFGSNLTIVIHDDYGEEDDANDRDSRSG